MCEPHLNSFMSLSNDPLLNSLRCDIMSTFYTAIYQTADSGFWTDKKEINKIFIDRHLLKLKLDEFGNDPPELTNLSISVQKEFHSMHLECREGTNEDNPHCR